MTPPVADILERIEALLRQGRQPEARLLLKDFLQAHPDSSRGWWLMSLAAADPAEKNAALRHVRRPDPENEPAPEEPPTQPVVSAPSSTAFVDAPLPEEPPAPAIIEPSAGPVPPPSRPILIEENEPAFPPPPVPAPPAPPRRKLTLLDLFLGGVTVVVLAAAGAYLNQQRLTNLHQQRTISAQQTHAVALMMTHLPSLTFTPSYTVSSTRTITPTHTLTPTLRPTRTSAFTGSPTRR